MGLTMWAQIVTFGTMAARGAIRDVGRALNFTYGETDVVAKLVPSTPHITLDEALKTSPQLKEMYDGDERVQKLIDMARALEGMPRNTSTHAAGVVITKLPVEHYVPLSKNDDTVVTQYPMTTIEELGPSENGLSGPAEPDGYCRGGGGDSKNRTGILHGPHSR